MIRAGVLPPEVRQTDTCPACGGNGEVLVERLFGRNAPEPYLMRQCGACGGEGVVDADAVGHCALPGCEEIFWADAGCTHMPDSPLCTDHRPANCRDCIDEHGGLDR